MSIKQQLILELRNIISELGIEGIDPIVEYPTDPTHGDYSTNLALIAAKKLGKNPRELAEHLVRELRINNQESRIFEKIEIAGPGFINFWVKPEVLYSAAQNEEVPNVGKERPVVVEYSSPNIAKPFTIGHLRSTIIGDAIANLLEATGWKVYRDNHIGDWGTQFGKQIYAIKKWGDEEAIDNAERPVKLLVDLYIKFHDEAEKDPSLEEKAREWFKKLEDGDPEARLLWQKCIDWSWKEFETIYQQLDVSFTENGGRGYGEAFFEDKMGGVIAELEEKGLLQEGKEGAKLVFFPDDEYTPLMILKKDGATLYSTRDLATDTFRLEKYGREVKIINEVGAEQALYFKQLYKVEQILGWFLKDQRVHKKHGLYRFKEGKMSTRKGNVIWLEDVLEEAKRRALFLKTEKQAKPTMLTVAAETERTPEEKRSGIISAKDQIENTVSIGIGALKWNDLKRSSEQDIIFDWDEMLTMHGNSGPYIQYTYARTQSVIARSETTKQSQNRLPRPAQADLAMTKSLQLEERELLRLLARFPEIVIEAAERLAPNVLCTYLFELAQGFNLFYQNCPILKSESKDFRLSLTTLTSEKLQEGLRLLGIKAPEKM